MSIMGFELQMGSRFGYGITTLNLLSQLYVQGKITPLILGQPAEMNLNPAQYLITKKLFNLKNAFFKDLSPQKKNQIINIQCPVLAPIGNAFELSNNWGRFKGNVNFAKIVFENNLIDSEAVERLQRYDALLPVSEWNMKALKESGLKNVVLTPEGIDPSLFHPAPSNNIWRDRFVIFSAGKLEYRKAQDLVIAAFKIFHQHHPDSLLCFCWHNLWPQSMLDMNASPHLRNLPDFDQKHIDFTSWLIEQGLNKKSFIDLGFVDHHHLPQVIRESTVALFPNRCEGGTNLMAMEAMACGVPVILSANSGHLDLISSDRIFPLNSQGSVKPQPMWRGTDGWGESSIGEILETLEYVYQNTSEAKKKAAYAARWMLKERSWDRCAEVFTRAVQKYV